MPTSNSMNRVKAPVSAYPVKRIALLSMALALFRPNKCPQHAEGVLGLGIAVAPEHVLRLHTGGATGVHRALPPAINVLDRQHQAKPGGRGIRTAMLGIGITEHHRVAVDVKMHMHGAA